MDGLTEQLVMACDVCMGINSDKCPCCGKELETIPCPHCEGVGTIYVAYHINGTDETNVNPLAWECLPETEEMAEYLGKKWFQGEKYRCPECYGDGVVVVEQEDYWEEDL